MDEGRKEQMSEGTKQCLMILHEKNSTFVFGYQIIINIAWNSGINK